MVSPPVTDRSMLRTSGSSGFHSFTSLTLKTHSQKKKKKRQWMAAYGTVENLIKITNLGLHHRPTKTILPNVEH